MRTRTPKSAPATSVTPHWRLPANPTTHSPILYMPHLSIPCPTLFRLASLGAIAGLSLTVPAWSFVISSAPGLFAPSFRDAADADANNTTAFGWGVAAGARFDGATDDDNIDNPGVTISAGGLNGTLIQSPQNTEGDGSMTDILTSTNNIYSNPGGANIALWVPINGSVGAGFTTIIVQGRTAFGGYSAEVGSMFGEAGGASPSFATGINMAGQGQFWAKYEISGNLGGYTIPMTLPIGSSISIAELKVDAQFNSTGFVPDFAVVPEPTVSLLGLAGVGLVLRRRRCQP